MFAGPLDEAKVLISRGDISPAIQVLSQFLNDDFWHDEALFMLGACYIAQGMNGLGAVTTSAAIDARMAKKGKPFPEALLNLGAAHKADHDNANDEKAWRDSLGHETMPRRARRYIGSLVTS